MQTVDIELSTGLSGVHIVDFSLTQQTVIQFDLRHAGTSINPTDLPQVGLSFLSSTGETVHSGIITYKGGTWATSISGLALERHRDMTLTMRVHWRGLYNGHRCQVPVD